MADIQYLNYGDLQIELLALLNNLANQVQGYVQKQPWSNKRKEKFMSAYSDLMNKGLIGASNKTGQWVIDVNGDIPFDSMDKKDKEMYQEAAYFIQQLMSQLPTKAAEEEKKKEELQLFDNDYFTKSFGTLVNNRMAGGRDLQIGGENDLWNYLDERDSSGKRGRSKRAGKLAELLEEYSNSLEEGKYNFEGSPFKDLNEFKGRLNEAVSALRSEDINDDTPALNALGLNATKWFNNGTGDPSGFVDKETGKELTYGELAEYNANLAKLKAEQEKAVLEAKNKASYNNTIFINRVTSPKMLGRSAIELKEKYKDNNGLMTALQEYALRDIRHLTPDEISEVHGAYKNLAKSPIDNNLLKQLQSSSSGLYRNAAPNRFRKINGIDNLIWDDAAKQVIQINTREQQAALQNEPADLFAGVLDKKGAREEYLKSSKDGLTSAEWEELASIGFDIASIVDPEMISAGALALTGSGLRHHALASQPGGMSTSDKWWLAADYGLSILGSVPVLGDSALAFRALNNLKKAIVPLGLVMAGANVPQAAKAAYNKVVKGEDLTILDWRAIGAVLTAAVGMGRGRLMAKRAEALQRTAGKTLKTVVEGSVKTDKGEIKGLSELTTKELQESFKAAGTDNAAKTKALRDHPDVQAKARELGIDLKKASVDTKYSKLDKAKNKVKIGLKTPEITTTTRTESVGGSRMNTLRAMAEFNRNHGWLARKGLAEQDWVFRHTGGYNSNVNNVNWFKQAWNSLKKSEWDKFGLKQNTTTTTTNPSPAATTNPTTTPQSTGSNAKPKPPILSKKDSLELLSTLRGKNFSTNEFKDENRVVGTVKGFGDLYGIKNTDGTHTLQIDFGGTKVEVTGTKADIKAKTLEVLKKDIMKKIDSLIPKEKRSSIKFELIKKLKENGYLKQGGKLTDLQINNFLKQYK